MFAQPANDVHGGIRSWDADPRSPSLQLTTLHSLGDRYHRPYARCRYPGLPPGLQPDLAAWVGLLCRSRLAPKRLIWLGSRSCQLTPRLRGGRPRRRPVHRLNKKAGGNHSLYLLFLFVDIRSSLSVWATSTKLVVFAQKTHKKKKQNKKKKKYKNIHKTTTELIFFRVQCSRAEPAMRNGRPAVVEQLG